MLRKNDGMEFGRLAYISIRIMLITLLVVFFANFLFAYNADVSSVIDDTTVVDCGSIGSNFINSIVNHSTVECSNFTNSNATYSVVKDASMNITDSILTFARISGDTLTSGQIVYNGFTYFGPQSLDKIFAGSFPSQTGKLSFNVSYTNSTGTFRAFYDIGRLGYSVSIDASSIGASSGIQFYDNGLGNDLVANDGVYTSTDITVDSVASGTYSLVASINDGFGNSWSLTRNISIDGTLPTVSFYISSSDSNEDSLVTTSRIVTLHISASDDNGISGCRFSNSVSGLASSAFESCISSQPWMIDASNGVKTVYYEVMDNAGNVRVGSDTITLDALILDAPLVFDTGKYWGSSNSVDFEIYYPPGIEVGSLTYDFRVYNATGCLNYNDNSCNVTPWIEISDSDVTYTLTETNLLSGFNYTIGARSYLGGVSNQGLSDGFILDLTSPVIDSLASSVNNATWTSDDVVILRLNASDVESGIKGYSYSVSSSNTVPDNVIDTFSSNIYVTGISEGIFYVNVKAISGALSSSQTKSFLLYIDTTRPIPPLNPYSAAAPSGDYIRLSWDPATDVSGIVSYEVVIASDPSFNNIVRTVVLSDTYYDFESTGQQVYFKVRALNGAGLYSYYSDELDFISDVTPPALERITPNGYVNRKRPLLHVETDEDATCSFKKSVDSSFLDFEFTGSQIHDQLLSLEDGTSYSYVIRCKDKLGNSNTTTISFMVDSSKAPNEITTNTQRIDSYAGILNTINITVLSGSNPISGLDPTLFGITIDGTTSTDFGVSELGNGIYEISFRSPQDKMGALSLVIKYNSVNSNPIILDLKEIYLEVSYVLESGSVIESTKHISYSEQSNYTVGIASESDTMLFNNSENLNLLKSKNFFGESDLLIFFTPVNISNIKVSERSLDSRSFLKKHRPSFYSISSDKIIVGISLSYPNILFEKYEYGSRGDKSIFIQNRGITSDKRTNITVNIE